MTVGLDAGRSRRRLSIMKELRSPRRHLDLPRMSEFMRHDMEVLGVRNIIGVLSVVGGEWNNFRRNPRHYLIRLGIDV